MTSHFNNICIKCCMDLSCFGASLSKGGWNMQRRLTLIELNRNCLFVGFYVVNINETSVGSLPVFENSLLVATIWYDPEQKCVLCIVCWCLLKIITAMQPVSMETQSLIENQGNCRKTDGNGTTKEVKPTLRLKSRWQGRRSKASLVVRDMTAG